MNASCTRSGGFTLIELMIVIAVLGIIGALAYPTYLEQVRKARRSDAQSALLSVAQALERCYTEFGGYDEEKCGAITVDAKNNKQLASDYTSTTNDHYEISATTLTSTTFTLKATPKGDQLNDRCGYLTYTHAGKKGVEKDVDGDGTAGDDDDVATCW